MKRSSSFAFFLVLTLLVAGGGAGLAMQRAESATLRSELERAKFEADQLAKLRAENQRLRAQQIPAAQLEALRADHVAVTQLRAQLDALSGPSR